MIPMRGPYRGKRMFDLMVLVFVLVPALIVGVACSLAIWFLSPGPVFFRQIRSGIRGRPFRVFKFRTMVDAVDNPIIPDETRITGIGRWLRRLSLDELPQLLNVASGDMSIVGPRPTMPYQVERYTPRQLGRLSVRPGITGLAQVRGRNSLTWAARIEFDLEYVERQSPGLDLQIIFETIGAVAGGSGVEGHDPDDAISSVDRP